MKLREQFLSAWFVGSLVVGAFVGIAVADLVSEYRGQMLLGDKTGVASVAIKPGGNLAATFDAGGLTVPVALDGFWSVQGSGNQQCETTCTNGACVMGINTGAAAFLACNDGSADTCLCAGN